MGVNIFTGGRAGASSKPKAKTPSNAGVTNGSPSKVPTAVTINKQGLLNKVAGFAQKALPVVSSIMPGPIGAIAKGLTSVFNDPEWWQSVPGTGMSTNLPLMIAHRQVKLDSPSLHKTFEGTQLRGAILAIRSAGTAVEIKSEGGVRMFMNPSEDAINAYLMTEVRKVVNAIPLQSNKDYGDVFARNCAIYMLWRHLLKIDYMMKHGQTYLPTLNTTAFPVMQTANAAWLQSTILRLEETLSSSIRLPHTMCEYLSWRFGRIFKSNTSAKSGLVLYCPISLEMSIADTQDIIDYLINFASSTPERAQASVDLYNAYVDHTQAVEIKEDTQFHYDAKEFLLRTNLDSSYQGTDDRFPAMSYSKELIILDSELDNPTTFMASTVSCRPTGYSSLMPVNFVSAYFYSNEDATKFGDKINTSDYYHVGIASKVVKLAELTSKDLGVIALAKALDYYIGDFYIQVDETHYINPTVLSMDAGYVDPTVIADTQKYAFANLVYGARKHSVSDSAKVVQVAKDVATLVDSSVKEPTTVSVQK